MTKFIFCFKNLFLFLLLIFSQRLNAREWIVLKSTSPVPFECKLVSSDVENSILTFSLGGFFKDEVITERGKAFVITTTDATQILKVGAPDLPKFTASVIIPDQSAMNVKVTASTYQDFQNFEIAPSKGNLLRTINPHEVPFKYGDTYLRDAFYPSEVATLRTPYVLRDLRGQTVIVNPFQYNPVTKVLRVYTNITVRVFVDKLIGENVLKRATPLDKLNSEFASIYQHHFKNFSSVQYLPVDENGGLLVICPSQWMNILQPLVDWKIQKGIPTEMVDVITAGGTAANINDYIANYYIAHNLTHVLLVGDDAQVPTRIASGGASDASYGYVVGNDSYAEVFVGRFSAQTTADVQTQVDRTLSYEKYPDSLGGWYNNGVVIASNQGPGDDGEMDWEHAVNIRTDLLGYTYSNVAELYDGTHPGTTDLTGNPNNIDLLNQIQSGASIMCYTGHGSTTSFGTSGFSNSDISFLTNVNHLPFIWSVGCVNGNFQQTNGPCIGEAFLNAQYNGQPTGAIATMMSSINQSWDPPMDAQDEMVDILVETYSNNIKRTFGGISVNGCMHMNDQYGLAGNAITDTWICFGDPTLNVRTAVPQPIVVSHVYTITVGTSSFIVNCNLDGAYVALTLNNQIISTGIVNGGSLQLNFTTINIIDTIKVTVTGFNLMPYFADVLIVPASGPYVVYKSDSSNDVTGNGNGIIEYNETVSIDLTLKNLGLSAGNNLNIVLSTVDQYVNIVKANAMLANISANTDKTIYDAFTYLTAANIPDQHVIQFLLTVSDSTGNSWISAFTQVVNAPDIVIGNLFINDSIAGNGNGILEPGETGDLMIEYLNNGHSDALSGFGSLSTSSSFLALNVASSNLNVLIAQAQTSVTFNVTLSNNQIFATPYDFTCQLSAGAYFKSKLFYRLAGENLEDFETNNFNKYAWGLMGNQNWFTTNYLPFQGAYCAQSGGVNDNETTGLRLVVNVLVDDSVSFWCRVSSEQDWDYLYFKIDNVKVGLWSGILPWTFASYSIGAGTHMLTFSYEKDQAISTGMDCAWLDNIKLPPGALVTSINEAHADQNGVICYPNPVNLFLNISFYDKNMGLAEIELLDINGRLIKSAVFNQKIGIRFMQLSTEDIADGIYLLKIESSNQTYFKKIIIN